MKSWNRSLCRLLDGSWNPCKEIPTVSSYYFENWFDNSPHLTKDFKSGHSMNTCKYTISNYKSDRNFLTSNHFVLFRNYFLTFMCIVLLITPTKFDQIHMTTSVFKGEKNKTSNDWFEIVLFQNRLLFSIVKEHVNKL